MIKTVSVYDLFSLYQLAIKICVQKIYKIFHKNQNNISIFLRMRKYSLKKK